MPIPWSWYYMGSDKWNHLLIVVGIILSVCFFLFGFDRRNHLLGKIIVLGGLVYLSSQNLSYGLLGALAIIAYFKATGTLEAMENRSGATAASSPEEEDDKPLKKVSPNKPSPPPPISPTGTIDLESVKLAVQPKNSNAMSVPPAQGSTKDVAPASKESFRSMASAY